ncbi:uncharacterized protein LOC110819240, partial [Carica papaya]|uniref:uncharacterized protein LOC110819240 n=1 Tax=Carica papaya TaxID=3649 RepID=UPI000B8D0265
MSASSMGSISILAFLLLAALAEHKMAQSEKRPESSRITVVGVVYCDTCSSNSFSRHSYFLPGAEVNIRCKFKAHSPKTAEEINFSVNRTTGKNGVYKMEIPNVDGVNCLDGLAIASSCQASLIGSSNSECNVFGLHTTTEEISIKSKQDNLCIYNMNALNFRPSKRNATLCGNKKRQEMLEPAISSLNSLNALGSFP